MKKSILIFLGVVFGLFFVITIISVIRFNSMNQKRAFPERKIITSFAECGAAGNPVMESYPRLCRADGKTFTEVITPKSSLTEAQARVIAEKACIKGGEALSTGVYNEGTRTWWFDANLDSVHEGCNPACVVSEETQFAEINWRCTGLVIPKGVREEVQKLFVEKYPRYTNTLTVNINQETENHLRGSVIFEIGAPGGVFLATKIDGTWQIVFDGNGQIPCSLSKYGFPTNMLADCS